MESQRQHSVDADEGHQCPLCEASAVTRWQASVYSYGEGDATVDIPVDLPVRVCGACDFEYLDEEGERLQHEALCRHLGVLTPWDIREIRKSHGMTRSQFAELTGLGEASLGRWERGAGIQSHANDRYLRMLALANGVSWLRRALRSQTVEHRSGVAKAGRFRLLVDSAELRAEQQGFVLRKAA